MVIALGRNVRAKIGSAGRWVRRTLNVELNQFSYNLQTLSTRGVPLVYQVELTNHCPMTCVMCPRTSAMTRPLGYMDEPMFHTVIREISSFSKRIFLHHFGDSLVHPHLGSFIGHAERHGVETYLSANPTLLTEARIRSLVDNGLRELVISLDGVTPETSAAVRGSAARDVEKAEQRILELLEYRRRCERKKPVIVLQFVRSELNRHETDAWLAKWTAVKGIDRIKVKSYIGWDGRDERINELRVNAPPDTTDLVCDKPWTSVTILWDGRVVPCCFDHDGSYVLGNLRDQSLKAVFDGEPMRELRRAHRDRRLEDVSLCATCVDKAGYPVRSWTYPLNRLFLYRDPVGEEDAFSA